MKIIKVKCGDRSIPGWVVKTLKGTKKTAPYMFKAVTPDALDNLGDLAAWCQNNGSPASKVVNTGSGRFIKITDPLCRELELANLVKDIEDGYGEYDEVWDFCKKSNRRFGVVEANFDPSVRANDIRVWISWSSTTNADPYQMQKDLQQAISHAEKTIADIKKKFPRWTIIGNVKGAK